MAYWLLKYIFLGPLLAILGRPKIEGLEYVPQSGPAILASNHLAVMDSFYLPLVVRRRITFLAKSDRRMMSLPPSLLSLSYRKNRSTPISLWNASHSNRYGASSLKIAQTAILSILSTPRQNRG